MMTEYKCVVCKMPMLVLEDKIGNGDTPIGRCVHSNCVMSSIWLPIEALDEIERLQERVAELEADKEQVCEWIIEKTSDGQYKKNRSCEPNCIYWGQIYEKQIRCPNCGKRIKYVEES